MLSYRSILITALFSAPALAQTPCAWQVEGGNLMIEVETEGPAGWTVDTQYPGFGGTSFYRWDGPDFFNNPGNAVLRYDIEVHEAGTYELRLHNRHQHNDSTEENDCWTRMDNGSWEKTFSNGPGTVNNWTWETEFELPGFPDASFDLSVGRHVFEISARSNGFMIDRINFHIGDPAGAEDVNTPVGDCGLSANYCSSTPNSSGGAARVEALGSIEIGDNALQLLARPIPSGTFGLFFFGPNAIDVPFGNGRRCVGGTTRRLRAVQAQGSSLRIDVNLTAGAAAVINAGSSWNFQAWFRDTPAGGARFDLSDGMHVNFLP